MENSNDFLPLDTAKIHVPDLREKEILDKLEKECCYFGFGFEDLPQDPACIGKKA